MLDSSHNKIGRIQLCMVAFPGVDFEWNLDLLGLTLVLLVFRFEVGVSVEGNRVGYTVVLVAFDAIFRHDVACLFTSFQVKFLSEFRVIYSNESD